MHEAGNFKRSLLQVLGAGCICTACFLEHPPMTQEQMRHQFLCTACYSSLHGCV